MFGARRNRDIVFVLMMFVMEMFMVVHNNVVIMLMLMALSQMKPSTQGHQHTGYN